MPEEFILLRGGLDLHTPYLQIPNGACIRARNFEPDLSGGYSRIHGYERFDGRPKPHLQTYTAIEVADASLVAIGSTITGVTSGATGVVVARDTDVDIIAVTKITGTFVDSESITVTTITEVLGVELGPDDLNATWVLAAQDEYRGDIAAVPGSGSILGVWQHEGVVYAFRNNAGGTAANMYKSTAAGWVQVTLPNLLFFQSGTGTGIDVGDTLVGLSSGASADVIEIIKLSGTWGVDAAGYIVLGTITGGPFTDTEGLEVSSVGQATANGASYAHTLSPGGRYQFTSHNFFSTESTYNVYGCDGVNPAFQFDGTSMVPILYDDTVPNAPPVNAPSYIEAHKGHLFVAFPDGSVQHSVQGDPLLFSGFLGAAQFGLGAEIRGMKSETGEVLVIKTRRQTYGLYGSTVDDWELKLISGDTGAFDSTVQLLRYVIALDNTGVVHQPRTNAFGNFESATVTRRVRKLLDTMAPLVTCSTVIKSRNQYRLFASDNSFLMCYYDENAVDDQGMPAPGFQFMPGEYLVPVVTICNTEDTSGNELVFFGSDDGYVYQAEVGNNFDGEAIESFVQMPFSHARQPRHRKRYRYATIDLQYEGALSLRLSAEISSGDPRVLDFNTQSVTGGAGGFWDVDDWDSLYWDGSTISDMRYPLTGTGTNLSIMLYHNSATVAPFNLQSVQIDYDIRRKQR